MPSPPARLFLWRAAALASTLIILSTLSLPPDRLPTTSLGGADKVAHVLLFFVWALTVRRAGLGAGHVLMTGIVLAVGTEAGQWLMGVGRTADVADAVADLVGVALGATTAGAIEARRPTRPGETHPADD